MINIIGFKIALIFVFLMKKLLSLFLFFTVSVAFCQKKYAKEFNFISDNDLYVSFYQDRYYTNGLFFTYRYLVKNENDNVAKKTHHLQLGHHIYTPFNPTVSIKQLHDRPFAGLLFGNFGVNTFYKNESIIKYSVSFGVIGSNSYARELQKFIHDIYGFKNAIGWKYQIANALALNGNISYIKSLVKDASFTNDINWVNTLNVGTVFSDISTGFYTRIGLTSLQPLTNSIAFNGNLNNASTGFNNKKEVFLYFKPMFSYVHYDATIQGSFLNKNSPVTYLLKPFKFSLETGIRFTSNRFNFGYSIHYYTKKLKSVRVPKGNFYGSLQFNYQFN